MAMKVHLHETSRDIAEREHLVLPLEDREQHDGAADVRDDEEQLQERSEEDGLLSAPRAGDIAGGVVEDRLKEIQRRDRGGEGDEEQHPGDPRSPLV